MSWCHLMSWCCAFGDLWHHHIVMLIKSFDGMSVTSFEIMLFMMSVVMSFDIIYVVVSYEGAAAKLLGTLVFFVLYISFTWKLLCWDNLYSLILIHPVTSVSCSCYSLSFRHSASQNVATAAIFQREGLVMTK